MTAATHTPTRFVDFKEVKSRVNIVQVLERYDLMSELRSSGDRLSGRCPIHAGTNQTHFRVSISKNCFNCFGKCGRGGNVIDFVSLMEQIEFRDAALLLQEWFMPEKALERSSRTKTSSSRASKPAKSSSSPDCHDSNAEQANGSGSAAVSTVNAPLTFELKSLNPEHPYLESRGVSSDAVEHFGLGYCSRGYLRGYIAIPIHNKSGELVAYAGRWPNAKSASQPKYKLPKGFAKSLEVFNLHRALREPVNLPLVVVEGFFDCIALWEAGIPKCVALMGSSISPSQEKLLMETLPSGGELEILFDADRAGRNGAEQVREALAAHARVRVIDIPGEGRQADQLKPDELAILFE